MLPAQKLLQALHYTFTCLLQVHFFLYATSAETTASTPLHFFLSYIKQSCALNAVHVLSTAPSYSVSQKTFKQRTSKKKDLVLPVSKQYSFQGGGSRAGGRSVQRRRGRRKCLRRQHALQGSDAHINTAGRASDSSKTVSGLRQ